MALWETMFAVVTPAEVSEREPIFGSFTPEELISVGIPADNVDKVRKIRTDKELEVIAATLPVLARQSLYALKAGETIDDVRRTTFSSAKQNKDGDLDAAAASPITLAEFAPINSEEALKAILEYPSEKWRVFLHPSQRRMVNKTYTGPARVLGGDEKPALYSYMLANNEIGEFLPIADVVKKAHKEGGFVHSDLTQVLGKLPIDVKALDLDYATFSAHKIGGPIGVGALYVKNGVPFKPLIIGGNQEKKRRGTTYNTAGIIGFGAALKYLLDHKTWET
jgi:hypothetical protein